MVQKMSILHLIVLSIWIPFTLSQPPPPANTSATCNGIALSYSLDSRAKIHPNVSNPADQPYKFAATATVLNSGATPLIAWSLLIGFANREVIVSADGAALTDAADSSFPYNTTLSEGPTAFSGSGNPDLKTAIATAGDLTQIQAKIPIIGTLFAPPNPFIPLPTSLSVSDPSLECPDVVVFPNNTISTCCMPNPKFKANATDDPLAGANATVSARRPGDLTIAYDVIQANPSSYLALVTLANNHPLGRLDNWHLGFEWMRGEFIYEIKGAYTTIKGPADCVLGLQGQYYQSLDFSSVANCQRKPVILDLPATMANDSVSGRITNCCRNGTLLPVEMDADQTKSAFQMQVFKMPPDLNRTSIFPPSNWRISGGALNPDFRCGPPIKVSPSEFPDPSGLQSNTLAISSWEIVCNISKPKGAKSKCCVSFSAYYNDTVVPCKTCACGCSAPSRTCNATAPALLLPPQALLVPFENRTALSVAWAQLKHYNVPNPMPCGDSCGVSINWHINSDFRQGWTSRVTLFNWEEVSFADWFMAAEMDSAAYAGYEDMYSFNGTAIGNNTIFMQGMPGLNYLVGEVDGVNPGDPRVPGKQQSVISFTKKNTPPINVVAGNGFPTKVFFNGEECSLPDMMPQSRGFRPGSGGKFMLVLVLITTYLVL